MPCHVCDSGWKVAYLHGQSWAVLRFNTDFQCYMTIWRETENFLGFYDSTSKYVLFNTSYHEILLCIFEKDSEVMNSETAQ